MGHTGPGPIVPAVLGRYVVAMHAVAGVLVSAMALPPLTADIVQHRNPSYPASAIAIKPSALNAWPQMRSYPAHKQIELPHIGS